MQRLERSLEGLHSEAPLLWWGSCSAPLTHPRREWEAPSGSASSAVPAGAGKVSISSGSLEMSWVATRHGPRIPADKSCLGGSFGRITRGQIIPFYCRGYSHSTQIFSFLMSWFLYDLLGAYIDDDDDDENSCSVFSTLCA